jgi:hypothetical protein
MRYPWNWIFGICFGLFLIACAIADARSRK